MSVAVVIPYGGQDAHRARALKLVLQHYLDNAPDWSIILAPSNETPYPKAKAVNKAVKAPGSDVLILNDADSLVPADQIHRAARMALEAPGLVFAFSRYRRLSREWTDRVTRPGVALFAPDSAVEWEMLNSGSHGCIAIQRACWDLVGGLDERYVGWGYEDLAFDVACERRWPARRVSGDLFHLWHPRPDDVALAGPSREAELANLALYEEGLARV